MTAHVAVDLGAGSGRVSCGIVEEDRLEFTVVSRFPNTPITVEGTLRWDARTLYNETLRGVRKALVSLEGREAPPVSLGVDSWGVDYGRAGRADDVLPRSYRGLPMGLAAGIREKIPAEHAYSVTGIESLHINTIYQLADELSREQAATTDPILLIPDLWIHRLTGALSAERTVASTTGLMDATTGDWAWQLAARAGIPDGILPPISATGAPAGRLRPEVARSLRAPAGFHVVHVAEHDTASAVAAIPATMPYAFISCGSWSLAGVELERPILSEDARLAGFTNETGAYGSTLFMRNLSGLRVLEECMREWADCREQGAASLTTLLSAAGSCDQMHSIVDLSHPAFIEPDGLPARIGEFCRSTGQTAPVSPAETTRCLMNSLAVAYRAAIGEAERLGDVGADVVHLIGGGSKNPLLCQLAADACERTVLAGPAEATSLGNILVQAVSAGTVTGLPHARSLVGAAFRPVRYEPGSPGPRSIDWGRQESLLTDLVNSRQEGAHP